MCQSTKVQQRKLLKKSTSKLYWSAVLELLYLVTFSHRCKVNAFALSDDINGPDFQHAPVRHRLQKTVETCQSVHSVNSVILVDCRSLRCFTSYRFCCFSGHSTNCFNEDEHPDSGLLYHFYIYIFFTSNTRSHSQGHAIMIHCLQGCELFFFYFTLYWLYRCLIGFYFFIFSTDFVALSSATHRIERDPKRETIWL